MFCLRYLPVIMWDWSYILISVIWSTLGNILFFIYSFLEFFFHFRLFYVFNTKQVGGGAFGAPHVVFFVLALILALSP